MSAKGWVAAATGLVLVAAMVTHGLREGGARDALSGGSRRTPTADVTVPTRAASREAANADAANPALIATSADVLEGWNRAQRDAVLRVIRELAARGDVESLLDAALLLPLACDGTADCAAVQAERARLLAIAARLAPDHPLIAFLQAEDCVRADNCAEAYRRLAMVDPDNLFVHLGLLRVAAQAGDPAVLDRVLREAAEASLYDAYHGTLTAELDRAMRRLPAPSAAVRAQLAAAMDLAGPLDQDDARFLQALGVSLAMGFPALQTLMQTCHVDGLRQAPARREPCLALLARMAASDTTLARSVGLTGLVRLTAGTAAGAHWREQLREFAWVQEQFLARQSSRGVADLRLQVERGEWVAMRAWLQRFGVPLQPPPGWLPSQAPYRQLLAASGSSVPPTRWSLAPFPVYAAIPVRWKRQRWA